MKKTILFFLIFFSCFYADAQIAVDRILCEYKVAPGIIDMQRPRLSWELCSAQHNVRQMAYQVLVADDTVLLNLNKGNIWDSKKVLSAESIQIPYSGKKLKSAHTYFWKVMVWDNHYHISKWSKSGKWQMGLLSSFDWKKAQWIGYEAMPDSLRLVPALENSDDLRWNTGTDVLPLLRKEFVLHGKIKQATVFVTGLGQFELSVNGEKVGDHFMDPGWTKYDKHALYLGFDVTDKLRQGNNAIGMMLGNGFYFIPGERYHKIKGQFGYPKMICRMIIQYQDGTTKNIISDQSWRTAPGPVTFSSIYGGEDYDANLEQRGWNSPDFHAVHWSSAKIVDGPSELNVQMEEPLKIFDIFSAKKITQPKPGIWVYDLGQNASAIPFIKVSGKKGDVIRITPAELLDDNGFVSQAAVGAPVYFNYTLKGNGIETWQPKFMYYGFRYIQVQGGVPENETNPDSIPVIKEIKSLHTRNAAQATGSFASSNELFNKIFSLIDWSVKSNTASIFTDCPHREKLGWLEEAYLVGSSIHYNYDIATVCRKVVRDMIKSQTAEGLIPDIAPEYVQFKDGFRDSPEWGSNGIIMPYYLYQWYGDKQVLSESYNMMSRYITYLENRSKNHILYFGLGDWYDLGPENPGKSQLTPEGITSTATFYYDLNIMIRVSGLLGMSKDAKKFASMAREVKSSFNKAFFNAITHQYGSGSQTANAMAVYMGLVEPDQKKAVIDNIVSDIRLHSNGLTAGDIGFRYLLRVLDDAGRSDVIFDMNNRADVPGYGYQLAMGATALTESWQGNRISSNNHFMLGHLMEWFYSGLGGIRASDSLPGFRDIIIRPEPVGDITHVNASCASPYGQISTSWEKKEKWFRLSVKIPVNTNAVIYLPAGKNESITENGRLLSNGHDRKFSELEGGKALVRVGSGNYVFMINK
jgi:alpha-L-rhamnosidase